MSKDRREDLLRIGGGRFGERLWPVLRLRWRTGVCRLPGNFDSLSTAGFLRVDTLGVDVASVSTIFPAGKVATPRCRNPCATPGAWGGPAGARHSHSHKSSWAENEWSG